MARGSICESSVIHKTVHKYSKPYNIFAMFIIQRIIKFKDFEVKRK